MTLATRPRTAIVLAAGLGARLGAAAGDRPKGLLVVAGETLVGRAVRLLRERGVERVVLVTGHRAEAFAPLVREASLECVHNSLYAETGTLASLAVALPRVPEAFLLLESDLFYEERALDAVLEADAPDVVLASGFTFATDEVWVEADGDGRLVGLSKDRARVGRVAGELVGITRLSPPLAAAMAAFARTASARAAYETDALAGLAARHPIAVRLEPALLWGEIDDAWQLARVRDVVVPAWQRARAVLLSPGPATTTESVKRALVIPDVCPRERAFGSVAHDVLTRLARLAGDPAEVAAVPVVGSGTTALEAALATFVPAGARVVVLDNGDYGARLARIAEVHGLSPRVVTLPWGRRIDVALVAAVLGEERGLATHLAFVHHETSSGVLNPLPELVDAARAAGVASIVDAMSSFGALPTPVGARGAEVVVASANKCLQGMAGLAFVVATRRALAQARTHPARTLALDVAAEHEHLARTGQGRFTLPPQLFSALRQALVELEEEGGPAGRRARHSRTMAALRAGLEELGLEVLASDGEPSGLLVCVRLPDEPWFDFDAAHDALLAQGFTIYPGKPAGPPAFRLSVIGAIDVPHVVRFVEALRAWRSRAPPGV